MKIKRMGIKQSGRWVVAALLAMQFTGSLSLNSAVDAATCSPATNFITTWKTDNPGASNTASITIPTIGGGYNYSVDWNNDDVMDQMNITGDVSHDFGAAGTYTIQICGDFPRIHFGSITSPADFRPKLISIDQWGDNAWTSMESAFYGASNLDVTATDTPNLSNVTSMQGMFEYNSSLVGNSSFNSWDVSNVTDMSGLFGSASSFNQSLSSWDVSNVIDMERTFVEASSFNQPLNSWDVSNVETMEFMFGSASAFNQPLDNWSTSSVTNTIGMFYYASSFNQPIGTWNMANVTDMYWMFYGASTFNQPLNSWDVSSAVELGVMFYEATSFNQPLDNWNVSNAQTMSYMFNGATSFNQSLASWDVSNVNDMSGMLDNTPAFSTANYDALLESWSTRTLQSAVMLDAAGKNFCISEVARQSIIDTYSWTITDAGQACLYIDTTDNLTAIDAITGQPLDNRVVPGVGESDTRLVRLLDGTVPLAEARAMFNTDLSWTDVTGESDSKTYKSVVSGLAAAPGVVGAHTLYVPKAAGHNTVIICEGADTLSDVTISCPGARKLTVKTTNVSIVVINGGTYWKVEGLNGTGGMSLAISGNADPMVPRAPQAGVYNQAGLAVPFLATVLLLLGMAGLMRLGANRQ